MKRALIAAGALILGGMPAMAGGIEGGVKNTYFSNFSTETINYGQRDIDVHTYSEVTWNGESESHKSFYDEMGSITGVSGSYTKDVSEGDDCGCYDKDSLDKSLEVTWEDPKYQFTSSEGWTNTNLYASGYDETTTNVSIYEEYEGYSESSEHGHSATSFASAF